MKVRKAIHLGLAEVRSAVAEQAYLKAGLDFTKPTMVMATVNERCNYRCPMCDFWSTTRQREAEMTIAQWKQALGSLRDFLGHYLVALLGGEPFIKAGFLDLLEFCREKGIAFSTTTNGSLLLRGETIRRLVASAPVHLNISVDGPTAGIHDRSRGVPGSLENIERSIGAIRDEQRRTGIHFPLRIKPTVHAWNFRSMPEMTDWTRRVGADTVDFEPVREWTSSVARDLWIEAGDLEDFQVVVAEIVAQKRGGAPIETSEHRLRGMVEHFARLTVLPEVTPCRVGLRRYAISPKGDVTTCWFFDPIGNVIRQSAREIWTGAVARQQRHETVACGKACAYSCMAQKPLKNLLDRGRLLLSANRKLSTISVPLSGIAPASTE